jgi:hypothetical protein
MMCSKPLPKLEFGRPCQLGSCPLCWPCPGTSGREASCPSPQGVVHIANSQKTNKLSPYSFCNFPRTYDNEDNAAQSPVLNNNQLPFKKLYTSKPLRGNKKGIGHKKKKSSLNYKAE